MGVVANINRHGSLLRRERLKIETVSLLIVVQNNTIIANSVGTKIEKYMGISKYRHCGNIDNTIKNTIKKI